MLLSINKVTPERPMNQAASAFVTETLNGMKQTVIPEKKIIVYF